LTALADAVNNGQAFEGYHFALSADVSCSQFYTPVGAYLESPFRGVFNGRGHRVTLSNWGLRTPFVGLFGVLGKDAYVSNVHVCTYDTLWLFAGTMTDQYAFGGGVAGYVDQGATIANCQSSASIRSGGSPAYPQYNVPATLPAGIYVGGIAGYNLGRVVNCTFNKPGRLMADQTYLKEGAACKRAGITAWNGTVGELNVTAIPKPVWTLNPSYAENFSGGNGTPDNPWIITTNKQLAQLAANVNGKSFHQVSGVKYSQAHYKLGNDINLLGGSWTPIGKVVSFSNMDNNPAFSGLFDGNGKRIIHFKVQGHTTQGDVTAGLFGLTNGALIRNLGIDASCEVDVSGTAGVLAGGLCGYALKTTIINCYNEANITTSGSSTASYAGGLVGMTAQQGRLENCYNAGNVSASGVGTAQVYAGGLTAGTGVVTYACYNTGNVEAKGEGTTNMAGGIAGMAYYGADIRGCLQVAGTVTASTQAARITNPMQGQPVTMDQNYGTTAITPSEAGTLTNNQGADLVVTPGDSTEWWRFDKLTITLSNQNVVEASGLAQLLDAWVQSYGPLYKNWESSSTAERPVRFLQPIYRVVQGMVKGGADAEVEAVLNGAVVAKVATEPDDQGNGLFTLSLLKGDYELAAYLSDGRAGNTRVKVANDSVTGLVIDTFFNAPDDYLWYVAPANGDNTRYSLGNLAELKAFANLVNGTVPVSTPEANAAQFGLVQRAIRNNLAASGTSDFFGPTNGRMTLATITLTADIDLGGQHDLPETYWKPIGSNTGTTAPARFKGIFDGDGHELTNLVIRDTVNKTVLYTGLFGYIQDGVVRNLGLGKGSSLVVTTVEHYDNNKQLYIGALAGYVTGQSDILHCYATIPITLNSNYGYESYVGGLTGSQMRSRLMSNCYVGADLSANGYGRVNMGGLTGYLYETTLSNGYFNGNVRGSGYDHVVAGIAAGGFYGTVRNCVVMNAAELKGSDMYSGRIIRKQSEATLMNNYANKQVVISDYDKSDGYARDQFQGGSFESVDLDSHPWQQWDIDSLMIDGGGWLQAHNVLQCFNAYVFANGSPYVTVAQADSSTVQQPLSFSRLALHRLTGSIVRGETSTVTAWQDDMPLAAVQAVAAGEGTAHYALWLPEGTFDVEARKADGEFGRLPLVMEKDDKVLDIHDLKARAPRDYRWYTEPTQYGVYTISNLAELQAFEHLVNGTVPSTDAFGGLKEYDVVRDSIKLRMGSAATNDDFDRLQGGRQLVATVLLANDIDLGGVTGNPATYWTPIGHNYQPAYRFKGRFDGQGHTLSNLVVEQKPNTGIAYAGFFGYVGGEARVTNLGINAGGEVTAKAGSINFAGALVAYLEGPVALVENCHSALTVSSTGGQVNYAGGLVGVNKNADVKNALVQLAAITGTTAGRVVGYSEGRQANLYALPTVRVNGAAVTAYTGPATIEGADPLLGTDQGLTDALAVLNAWVYERSKTTHSLSGWMLNDQNLVFNKAPLLSVKGTVNEAVDVVEVRQTHTLLARVPVKENRFEVALPADSFTLVAKTPDGRYSTKGLALTASTVDGTTVDGTTVNGSTVNGSTVDGVTFDAFHSIFEWYLSPAATDENGHGLVYEIDNAFEWEAFGQLLNGTVNPAATDVLSRLQANTNQTVQSFDGFGNFQGGRSKKAVIKLTGDLDLGSKAGNSINRWTPMAKQSVGKEMISLKGIVDGQGHTINGLFIHETGEKAYAGLFERLENGGQIRDLGLGDRVWVEAYGSTEAVAGGFAAWMNGYDSRLQNLFTRAFVSAGGHPGATAGGFVGQVTEGAVVNVVALSGNTTAELAGRVTGTDKGQRMNALSMKTATVNNKVPTTALGMDALNGAHPADGQDQGVTAALAVLNGWVYANSHSSHAYKPWTTGQQQKLTFAKLALNRLEGRILDGQGAWVELRASDGVKRVAEQAADSLAGDGLFAFYVPDGTYTVVAVRPDGATGHRVASVAGSELSMDPVVLGLPHRWYTQPVSGDKSRYVLKQAGELRMLAHIVNGTVPEGIDYEVLRAAIQDNLGQTATRDGFGPIPGKRAVRAILNLTADLALGGETPEGEPLDGETVQQSTDWIPIGGMETPFMGVLDGLGHTLTGLYVDVTDDRALAGLFGRLSDGAGVKNLRLAGENVVKATGASANRAGLIAAIMDSSDTFVLNVAVSGSLNAAAVTVTPSQGDSNRLVGSLAGGVVGELAGGRLLNAFMAEGSVVGTEAGRLVGRSAGLLGANLALPSVTVNGLQVSEHIGDSLVNGAHPLEDQAGVLANAVYRLNNWVFNHHTPEQSLVPWAILQEGGLTLQVGVPLYKVYGSILSGSKAQIRVTDRPDGQRIANQSATVSGNGKDGAYAFYLPSGQYTFAASDERGRAQVFELEVGDTLVQRPFDWFIAPVPQAYRWYTDCVDTLNYSLASLNDLEAFANLVSGFLPDSVTNVPTSDPFYGNDASYEAVKLYMGRIAKGSGMESSDHFGGYGASGKRHTQAVVTLLNDIDMAERFGQYAGPDSTRVGWPGIGTYYKRFMGLFEGNHKRVVNLYATNQKQMDAGLFGTLGDGAVLRNLSVKGMADVGSCNALLAARAIRATIVNCHAEGQVIVDREGAGLVGSGIDLALINCSVNNLSVSASSYGMPVLGGLVASLSSYGENNLHSYVLGCVASGVSMNAAYNQQYAYMGALVGSFSTSSRMAGCMVRKVGYWASAGAGGAIIGTHSSGPVNGCFYISDGDQGNNGIGQWGGAVKDPEFSIPIWGTGSSVDMVQTGRVGSARELNDKVMAMNSALYSFQEELSPQVAAYLCQYVTAASLDSLPVLVPWRNDFVKLSGSVYRMPNRTIEVLDSVGVLVAKGVTASSSESADTDGVYAFYVPANANYSVFLMENSGSYACVDTFVGQQAVVVDIAALKSPYDWYVNPERGDNRTYVIRNKAELKAFREIVNGWVSNLSSTQAVLATMSANSNGKASDHFGVYTGSESARSGQATVLLAKNIDLGGDANDQSTLWYPIGTDINQPFRGVFDGQGRFINDMFQHHRYSEVNQGLFGFMTGGVIRRLSVLNSSMSSRGTIPEHYGLLLGYNNGGLVDSCVVSGFVGGTNNVGGLVGCNNNGIVRSCIARDVTVEAVQQMGCLVGSNEGTSQLVGCLVTGNSRVLDKHGNGSASLGGFAGFNGSEALIQSCASTGFGYYDWRGPKASLVGNNQGLVKNSWVVSTLSLIHNGVSEPISESGNVSSLSDLLEKIPAMNDGIVTYNSSQTPDNQCSTLFNTTPDNTIAFF
jgi:hypothetical protein